MNKNQRLVAALERILSVPIESHAQNQRRDVPDEGHVDQGGSMKRNHRHRLFRGWLLALVVALASGVLLLASTASAGAATVTSLLGDKDGFGLGLSEGDTRASGTFNSQEPGDPLFTDRWPVSYGSEGFATFTYTQTFDVPAGLTLVSAQFKWLTLGIQDGDNQVVGSDVDIRLFLDGVEVPGAFDTVDQFGWFGGSWKELAGSVTITVPPALLPLLTDGSVDVTFETYALGTYQGVDGYAIDYSELTLGFGTTQEMLAGLHSAVQRVGPGTSLADKIENAQAAYDTGDESGTCEILNAFINQVEAQSGKKIEPATADDLIVDATRIRDVIGCSP